MPKNGHLFIHWLQIERRQWKQRQRICRARTELRGCTCTLRPCPCRMQTGQLGPGWLIARSWMVRDILISSRYCRHSSMLASLNRRTLDGTNCIWTILIDLYGTSNVTIRPSETVGQASCVVIASPLSTMLFELFYHSLAVDGREPVCKPFEHPNPTRSSENIFSRVAYRQLSPTVATVVK